MKDIKNTKLIRNIGSMLMFGFPGTTPSNEFAKEFISYIKQGMIGGTILFKRNIINPRQLKNLTSALFSINPHLFIAVDQEGGKVQRLNPNNQFCNTESAKHISHNYSEQEAKVIYYNMAKQLKENGININLAPVVDLDNIDKPCPVIGAIERSFSSDPKVIIKYASAFIKAHHEAGVLTSIKHFPGHGNASSDTHHGIVDVTNTWEDRELIPLANLINNGLVDSIMTAHIINKNIDKNNPSTLSQNTLQGYLRKKLNYNGVIITDDLQMGAIEEQYSLEETVIKSINAGCDILIFSNNNPKKANITDQNSKVDYEIIRPKHIIDLILKAIKNNDISIDRILESCSRINDLKNKLQSINFKK